MWGNESTVVYMNCDNSETRNVKNRKLKRASNGSVDRFAIAVLLFRQSHRRRSNRAKGRPAQVLGFAVVLVRGHDVSKRSAEETIDSRRQNCQLIQIAASGSA